jgi:ankyrin repeat protein
MSSQRLPVRPNLEQLKHQAKDLLRAIRRGDEDAIADLRESHSDPIAASDATLTDAQLALARSYGASSWTRLVLSCRLVEAIWEDDIDTARQIILQNPHFLFEDTVPRSRNWGEPMSYAANLGRDRLVKLFHSLGAKDIEHALGRATLQSRIDTARMIHALMGKPRVADDVLGGPAYTLSVSGTALMFELGARVVDDSGKSIAPVATVLQTDSRNPEAKLQILEMYVQHGTVLPDTPMMALHRGRIDLLEKHLEKDAGLLARHFSFVEIFPPEIGCIDSELPETRLALTTLLHVAIAFAELDVARWLLDNGMDVDTPAGIDANGFGGHTALFHAVVSYPNFWDNFTGGWSYKGPPTDSPAARLLLDHGANPNARASLHEPKKPWEGPRNPVFNVTPLGWGKIFSNRLIVSEPAMRIIRERGGVE